MQEPCRIHSTETLPTFVNLGNGLWYYNYDVKSETVSTKNGEETRYNFILIRTTGKPTYKVCVEKIIRLYISLSEEFDLINTYNMSFYNLLSDDEALIEADKYLNYLNLIKEIKSKVKLDFE